MITLALIGLGSWGSNYIKTIENIPFCRLKYLCATKEKSLKRFPDKYIKFKDYRKLYKQPDIDGVIIATPSNTHYKLVKIFLKKGYNLLIEKPATTNYQDILSLKPLVEKTKTQILVGHIFQYHPAYKKAKELVKKIGRIRYLDFEGTDLGPFRNDISVLWDWGPHDISMCLGIMKEMPLEVSAWKINQLRPKSKLYDIVIIRLDFKNNISAFIKMGWLSPVKRRKMVIVGTKSSVVFDDTLNKKVIYFKNIGPKVIGDKIKEKKVKISYPLYSKKTPLELQILEFINCIKNKNNPETDFFQSLKIAKIIHFAQKSILQNGKTVKIK